MPTQQKLSPEARAELENEYYCKRSSLLSNSSELGDWKVVKSMEAQLSGLPLPYDIEELHAKRQAVRDRINEIKAILDADDLIPA